MKRLASVSSSAVKTTTGAPPDPGFEGYEQQEGPTIHDIRKYALWATLMGGGAGIASLCIGGGQGGAMLIERSPLPEGEGVKFPSKGRG